MEKNTTFKTIWDLHTKWSQGILFQDTQNLSVAKLFFSNLPTSYMNFVLPLVDSPEKLDLVLIEATMKARGKVTAFDLFELHQQNGFEEYLVRNGFRLGYRSTFLFFNLSNYIEDKVLYPIINISQEKLDDYFLVAREAFEADADLQEKYMEMEKDFLSGKINYSVSDLSLELYAIYDGVRPVAIGALFYSKQENFGYLHDGGTLKTARGKGYQTSLLRHRVNVCLEKGIDRIYVTANHGNGSWRNCLRNGFEQIQTVEMLFKE